MTAILSNPATRAIPLATALVVVALNVSAKAIVEASLAVGEEWWLVEDWLGLDHVRNSGVAFGIASGSGAIAALLAVVAIGVLIWLIGVGGLAQSLPGLIATGLVLGGALANLLDRLPDGYVTDYLAIGPWPRFNIADSALTIGIATMLVLELRTTRSEPA